MVRKHCNLFRAKLDRRYSSVVLFFCSLKRLLIKDLKPKMLLLVWIFMIRLHVQDVNDVLAAIDHVIDMGLADPSKITVLGGSHGGFLTTHLIGQVF